MKYLIIIEETKTGFSAYAPDVDGCIAAGETEREVKELMREALEFHFEGLLLDNQEIPQPHTHPNYVEVTTAAL